MAIQVQLRRGTATQNNAFTGAIGELSFDTTNKQLRVHDGSTAGGFKIGTGNFPTGTNNVALGNTALDGLDGVSPGGNNTAVGHDALTANTTASFNTAIGVSSGSLITTGQKNTIVGSFDGNEGGLDIRTASNHIVLSDGDGNPRLIIDDSGNVDIGHETTELKLKNTTHEDTDGGRESKITFQGEQSGGEQSVLAQIQASHDATADDQKGDLIIRTNDGSDGTSPTERLRIDSAGRVKIGNSTAIAAGNAQYALLSVRGGTDSANSAGSLALASGQAAASLSDTNATGLISFGDAEGRETAYIISSMDGTPSSSNSSGDLEFWTTPSGGVTPNRKLTIDLDGDVLFEGTEKTTVNHTDGCVLFKTFNDGGSNTFSTTGHGLEGSVRDGNGIRHGGVRIIRTPGTGGGITSGAGIGLFTSGNTFFGYDQTRNNSLTYWASAFHFAPYNDNSSHLGDSSYRWQNIYATNSSIQTSDQREKQQIASLTDGEINAAKAISKLFKTYKWNKVVEAEGNGARIHTGVIAQEVVAALEAESLDPWRYAFLTKDIWWEHYVDVPAKEEILDADGKSIQVAQDATQERVVYKEEDDAPEGSTKKEMMGIRYPELFAFVSAATEQRLTSIETRLTALEG